MKENKIQIIISNVRHNQISVGAVEFTVQMKNSVDNINTWPNNREDTKGYIERSELEDILEAYRKSIIKKIRDDIEVIER